MPLLPSGGVGLQGIAETALTEFVGGRAVQVAVNVAGGRAWNANLLNPLDIALDVVPGVAAATWRTARAGRTVLDKLAVIGCNVATTDTGRREMDWQDRITVDPNILVGKPVIKGTRIAVEFIIDLLAQGWSEEEILRNYPGLTREDIGACLRYASAALHAERVYPFKMAEA